MDAAVSKTAISHSTHDIKPNEVRNWASAKWSLDLCEELAVRLNKMEWAGETSLWPELKKNELWARDVQYVDGKAIFSPWRAELDPESEYEDELADLVQRAKAAAGAAQKLGEMLPAWVELLHRLQHEEKLRRRLAWMYPNSFDWASSDATRLDAMNKFAEQLVSALPHFDFPLWKVTPRDHRKKRRPKDWHLPAVLIRGEIVHTFEERKLKRPGFYRDSVAIRVIYEALRRQGYNLTKRGRHTIADRLLAWDHQNTSTD